MKLALTLLCAMFVVLPASSAGATTELQRAEILVRDQHPQVAVPILNSIVKREPNNVRAWFLLGVANQDLAVMDGSNMPARQFYLKALAIDSSYAEAYSRLATLAAIEGDWKEDIRMSDRALACPKPDPFAFKSKAIAYSNLHEDKLALANFEKFLASGRTSPNNPKMLEMLATFQENVGHYDDAIKTWKTLQGTNKLSVSVSLSIVKCLCKANKFDEALISINKMISADRDREAEGLFDERAKIYTSMGKYAEAIKDYDQSIQLEPNKRSYLQRAALWEKLGNKDKAKADRQKSEQL